MLFGTPITHTVMVNKKNDVKIEKAVICKKKKCFIIKLLRLNVQYACNMNFKANYQIATSKAVVGVDPPLYTLS